MKYNIQTDAKWKNEVMTKTDKWCDTLGMYGCIITSLANILQLIMNRTFTPKDLNDIIKQLNGYLYLYDNKTQENMASIIVWSVINKYFSSTVKINTRVKEYKENCLYIAKINYPKSPTNFHYVNVLNKVKNKYIIFDVYDGTTSIIDISNVIYLHEVVIL